MRADDVHDVASSARRTSGRSTFTLPNSLTRPTSLRPRSTSMTCSARSFSSASISSASAWSSSSLAPRGRVPAMGRYSTLPLWTRTSSSGDEPASSRAASGRFTFWRSALTCRAPAQRTLGGKAQEVHIGAGIDGAQGAIDLEAVDAPAPRRSAARGRPGRRRRRRCTPWCARRRRGSPSCACDASPCSLPVAALCGGQIGQRLGEALFQLVEALDGVVVGVGGRCRWRDVGGDDQPDLLADVVEGQHLVEEEQAGVGNAELVVGQRRAGARSGARRRRRRSRPRRR